MKKYIFLLITLIVISGCSSTGLEDQLSTTQAELDNLMTQLDASTESNNALEAGLQELEEEIQVTSTTVEELEGEVGALLIVNEGLIEDLDASTSLAVSLQEENDALINKSFSQDGLLTGPYDGQYIMEAAFDILDALDSGDLAVLNSYIIPANGLKFAPNQNIDLSTMIQLSQAEITGMATDTTIYTWGNEPASGNNIDLTIADYFTQYVTDEYYKQAPVIGQNVVVSSGNLINNISTVYWHPDTQAIEFYYPSFDPSYGGLDWKSITLVFLTEDFSPSLLAIIHGSHTP